MNTEKPKESYVHPVEEEKSINGIPFTIKKGGITLRNHIAINVLNGFIAKNGVSKGQIETDIEIVFKYADEFIRQSEL